MIEEYQRPDRLVVHGTATFVTARVVFEFDAEDTTTRIEQVTNYEFLPQLGPLGRLLDDLVFKHVLADGQRESMRNFKRLVETEHIDAQ